MPNPFNITILDTSPIFQYLPSRDGPIDSSWNASFSGSPDSTWVPQSYGVGTSSHRTRLAGASVRLDWIGTAIYLYGEASVGAYTIQIDGSSASGIRTPGLLFAKSGLTYGPHTLILQVVQGTSTTSILSANVTVGMGEVGTIIRTRTIDTLTVPLTTDGIVLTGSWYVYLTTYGIGGPFVPRLATNVDNSAISFPISSATAFYIVGHVNFDHGPYLVSFSPPSDLGPELTYQYNGSSRWVGLNTLKFLATGLDRTRTYQVRVINWSNLYYDQSQIVIIDTPPDPSYSPKSNTTSASNGTANPNPSSLSGGAIAGIVIGLFLFIIILIFLLWRRRRQQAFSSSTTTSPSNPPISTALLSSSPIINPENPTTELRPPNPISTIPQSNRGPPLSSPTSLATTDVSPPSGYPTPSGLTPEDARFFNSLYALNVPPADIVTMMETLRVEREAAANANRIWQ